MSLRDSFQSFARSSQAAVLAVPTPELADLDGSVFVRQLASDDVLKIFEEAAPGANERTALVAAAACDSAGVRIFVDADASWLGSTAALVPVVERLYAAARHQNGLTGENRESWRKNLKSGGGGGSPSSSAAPSPAAGPTPTNC